MSASSVVVALFVAACCLTAVPKGLAVGILFGIVWLPIVVFVCVLSPWVGIPLVTFTLLIAWGALQRHNWNSTP